jgi:polysaccharide deacetylase 2 family uncharacterized protein YibQ
VVKISAVRADALACAGGRPIAISAVFDNTPYATQRSVHELRAESDGEKKATNCP